MKKFFLFLIFSAQIFAYADPPARKAPPRVSTPAPAPMTLDQEFEAVSKGIASGELQNAFCYANRDSEDPTKLNIDGVNPDSSVRLASISKVVTSLWAISILGPHFRFETKLSWNPRTKHLHISGSLDPFMGQGPLMFLVSELTRLKITSIESISFDNNFLVYEFADTKSSYESVVGAQENPPLQDSQIALLKYFNTRNWSKNLYRIYQGFRAQANTQKIMMVPSPNVSVREVVLGEVDEMLNDPEAIHYEYRSEELYKYLKHINSYSINYPPSIIFRSLGGPDALQKFLSYKLGFQKDTVKMFTGSGIEYYLNGDKTQRVDNESNCSSILKIIIALEAELKLNNLALPDVLLVAGVDHGTWNGTPNTTAEIAAKTGTLIQIPVANLAGMASSQDGEVYFGIFFQMKNRNEMSRAHIGKDKMADNLMAKNGGKSKIPLALRPQDFLPFSGPVDSVRDPLP